MAQGLDDEFMKKGILLIVDGTEPELVRGILETELVNLDTRHKSTIGFFLIIGQLLLLHGGMIGTLLGLVNMLKNLSDTASIGPNMAVALLTTLYGSLIANWICVPHYLISSSFRIMMNISFKILIMKVFFLFRQERTHELLRKSLSPSFHHLPEQHYLNKEEVKADG